MEELGNDEQKEEFLKPAVAGDYIAALGISEPSGGSDVANLKTRARIDGDDFVISGQKLWITNGTRADFIILAVRTGDEGHKGISMVLFPTKTKGFSVGKKLKKIGNLSSDTAELFFDNCRIPRRYLLGELNRGFYYTMINFQGERLAAALGALYKMERALEYAINYGKERKAFGQPIGSFQVWRHRFAEHLTSIEAAKWLCYRALDMMNRGEKCVARNHNGQALLQRAGSASDVRLYADHGRLRLHDRIPAWPGLARRPIEHHRRGRFGDHERDHREGREALIV